MTTLRTSRRGMLGTAAALPIAVLAGSARPQSEPFPSRTLRIVSAVAPGSGADIYARYYATKLTDILGKPVVVENKPGGDGAIAARAVLGEPPDGHTMLVGSNTPMAVNVVTVRNLPYDPQKDFRPIAGMSRTMAFFLVPAASPLRGVEDLVARGQRQPPLQSGTYSTGYQLAAAQFTAKAGFTFETVLYRGLAQTMTDLIAGRLDLAVVDSAGSLDMLKAGTVRAIAVTGERRHPDLPDVPALKDSGFPEAIHYSWTSLWTDARVPDARVAVLGDAMQKVIALPETKAFVEGAGGEMLPLDPEGMRRFQQSEIARFRRAAEASNFQPQ
jgi:tripartite-type tricarboxylate transporter receptor subunit TctC